MQKIFRNMIVLAITLLSCQTIYAAELTRSDVKIVKIHTVAQQRPADPQSQGYTRVYIEANKSDSTDTCRADAVDISPNDTYLRELLVEGWSNRRRIELTVDTELTPLPGKVCQLVNISISKW